VDLIDENNVSLRLHELLLACIIFSERELTFTLYVIACPSVVCRLSVMFVHPTQAIEIFGTVSTPFGTLAISDLSIQILRRSFQGNPSLGGVKTQEG